MFRHQLLRKRFGSQISSSSSRTASTTSSTKVSASQARINKVLDRVPKFLRPYTNGLRNAPVSHITTFLVLHEVTAIVPLVGLATYFHYSGALPLSFANSEYVSQGVEKFSRYFSRKGWFGLNRDNDSITTTENVMATEKANLSPGMQVVLEVSTAYAITKVLLPVRLLVIVWATPSVARVWLRTLGRMSAGKGMKNPTALAGIAGGAFAASGKRQRKT